MRKRPEGDTRAYFLQVLKNIAHQVPQAAPPYQDGASKVLRAWEDNIATRDDRNHHLLECQGENYSTTKDLWEVSVARAQGTWRRLML
jgi:hypothetical protein